MSGFKTIIFATLLASFIFAVASPVLAQSGTGGGAVGTEIFNELNKAGGSTGLSEKDPREIVASVIKGILALLGIVFLILMISAGFLWMTSGGESKKVEQAQGIIKTAIIGLVIVLLAYAITTFVGRFLLSATH